METTERIETWPKFTHRTAEVMYRRPKREIKNITTRLTIAYQIIDGQLEYQVAFCAPTDNFNRRRGRAISASRLSGKPLTVDALTLEKPIETIIADVIANRLPKYWVSANIF